MKLPLHPPELGSLEAAFRFLCGMTPRWRMAASASQAGNVVAQLVSLRGFPQAAVPGGKSPGVEFEMLLGPQLRMPRGQHPRIPDAACSLWDSSFRRGPQDFLHIPRRGRGGHSLRNHHRALQEAALWERPTAPPQILPYLETTVVVVALPSLGLPNPARLAAETGQRSLHRWAPLVAMDMRKSSGRARQEAQTKKTLGQTRQFPERSLRKWWEGRPQMCWQ